MRERGFALVAVLWVAMLLAIVVASVQQLSWAAAKQVHGSQTVAQANATADAVVNLVILQLLGPPGTQPPLDGTPFVVTWDGSEARTTVQDESGKVDINVVSDGMLRQLLIFAGLDAPDAAALTDRILDWRDATLARRLNGAKAAEYQAAGLDHAPRNAPFRAVDELQLVLGMTPALYAAVAPMVTVYSQTASVDPTFAPLRVLQMLAAFDAGAAAALRRRMIDASTIMRPSAGQHVALGHAFTIVTEVSGPGASRTRRVAVIRLTGQPDAPFWIYQWT